MQMDGTIYSDTVIAIDSCGGFTYVAYLEVRGIHPELESMQLAERTETSDKIIHHADCITDSSHDGLSMLLNWGRARAHISPVGEVGLSLRVDNQHSGENENSYYEFASI